jgi:hypothetical protein
MAERILGIPGKKRRRRLALLAPFALLVVGAVMLIAPGAAPALNTDGSTYSTQQDQQGANDVPGQKDLTIQGTNTSDMPTAINVLWNWDDTSVGGGNSLDGCALFDTDTAGAGLGQADAAFCATVANVSNSNKTLELKSTTLYTCGDTRSDRCSSQIAVVTSRSADTTCGGLDASSNTNPFGGNPDTRIFCTVVLDDIDATNAVLLNTCSYPSQQPNSDPSDCVLIPGKANPTIQTTTTLIPQDSATVSSNTNGSVTFELYKDGAVSGTTPDGVCDAGEKVFSQTDSSSPFATSNDGTPDANTLNGYTITTDGTYLWKVHYSGDNDNNPADSACGTEKIVTDLTP